jgi:TATA element modulatory factor
MSGSQPPRQKPRWGFSNLVAGLESRLDTILAEDDQSSAKARAAEEALKQQKAALAAVEAKARENQGEI